MEPTNNILFPGTLIITLINIGLISFLLTWGFLSISSRQNKFDQPAHTFASLQKTLHIHVGSVFVFIFLIIGIGLWLIIRSGTLYPNAAGRGGKPEHEMPYTTVIKLKARIEETLYDPDQLLNDQTRVALLSLDAALTTYQKEYVAKTYNHWKSAQSLLTYMEETEEIVPELGEQMPKYNHAKESLIRYIDTNEPYIKQRDSILPFALPILLYKSVWLERPFGNWVFLLGLIGVSCLLGVFFAYRTVHRNIQTHQNPETITTHENNLADEVTEQLNGRYTYQIHFFRKYDLSDNKGYFFIFHCLDNLTQENTSSQTLPVKCLLFSVDPNGKIKDPICEATYIRDNTGTRQEISTIARTKLINYISNTFNANEIQNLGSGLQLEIDTTNNPSPQQMAASIIDQLLALGRFCEIFDHFEELRPKDNWHKT